MSPIRVTAQVVGADRVLEHFDRLPKAAMERVRKAIRSLAFELERRVKTDWLAGRALNRRTGTLARSINTQFQSTASSETASVGTNVWYGRMWETTGHAAYEVRPNVARALYWKGARHPVASVRIPAAAPRPFLRPALAELRPLITPTVQRAVNTAMRDTVG